jgi:DNA-binding transcriptional ArsR family regulator
VIRFRVPSTGPGECVVLRYSPLLECLFSLHVLVGPRQHAHRHGWVRRLRALDPKLRRRIDAFSFVYRRQIPDLLLPKADDAPRSFATELASLADVSPRLLRAGLGGPTLAATCETNVEALSSQTSAEEPLSRETAMLLVDDPREFARQFGRLLEDYWRASFAEEWRRVEPLLRASVTEEKRLIATAGIWPLLARIPKSRADPFCRELRVECTVEHTVTVAPDAPLVLSPSAFVWPHGAVNSDPRWPAWIGYPAPSAMRAAVPELPPSALVEVLRALGDETRLRVLKAVAASPRTTQELAPLVGLSMAGLSKSLLRLADAGLVSRRREGRYVVYSLSSKRIAALSAAIGHFLESEEPRAHDGPGSSRSAA